MRNRISILIVFLFTLTSLVYAQPANDNCSSALYLCPNSSFASLNINATTEVGAGAADGATAGGNFCYALDNTVWFTFTTNANGGNADVAINNINCLAGGNADDQLQGVIVSAGTPCDESTYTLVSNCEVGNSSNFTLVGTGLAANTQYWVQIDGDLNGAGITDPAQCNFTIEVTGPAVDVVVTTTITDETCGASDGEIVVNTVSGAQSPYEYSIDGVNYQTATTFSGLTSGGYTIYIRDGAGCTYAASQEFVGITGGITSFTFSTIDGVCNSTVGEINVTNTIGGTPPYRYALNGGSPQSSNIFTSLTPGEYTVTVIDDIGCPYSLRVTVLSSNGPTTGKEVIIDATCGAQDASLQMAAVTGGTPPYNYQLDNGAQQSSDIFSNLAPGTYDITVYDASGCKYTLYQVYVSELPGAETPSVVIAGIPSPACVGDNIDFSSVVVNGGTAPNYEWFVNGVSVQSGAADTYASASLIDGDVVTCELTSNDPCVSLQTATSNTVPITITPPVTPTVTIVADQTDICNGDPVNYTATSPDCNSIADFEWYVNGTLVGTETTGMYTAPSLGDADRVHVVMNCNDLCAVPATSNTETINVTTVTVNAGENQVIGEGETTGLTGSSNGTIVWTPGSSLDDPTILNPNATPAVTTTYILTATLNGCIATDDVIVVVIQAIVPPNTFTPNGDGVNDSWEIANLKRYESCKVNVYSRWGQKVFSSTGYGDGQQWDGTNHGLKLPSATYYWVIDLNIDGADKDVTIFTGSVTLVY